MKKAIRGESTESRSDVEIEQQRIDAGRPNIDENYSDQEIAHMLPRDYSDSEIEQERVHAALIAKAYSLFDILQDVSTRIESVKAGSTEFGSPQELDILLTKKIEVEILLDEANSQLSEFEAGNKSQIADTVQAEGTTFAEVEEEPVSKLAPLAKRVKEMGERRRSSPQPAPVGESYQLDLFIADLLDYNLKDDAASMEAPIFSLATKPDLKIWRWTSEDGKRWLEVTPSVKGRATMHDKDLLIYLTSQLMAAMNNALRSGAKLPGRRVRFTLYDYLRSTGKDTSGRSYGTFEDSLDRLAGTRLKTNISLKKISERDSFGLIERFKIIQDEGSKDKRMVAVEVTLSEWLYGAIEEKEVLTISRDYFALRKPLEKKLYDLARKHVGNQPQWSVRERVLYEKTGSQATPREFRRMCGEIIESDSIPDHRYSTEVIDGENWAKAYQKDTKKLVEAFAKKAKRGEKLR